MSQTELQEISAIHESAFLKMIEDYRIGDAPSLRHLFDRGGAEPAQWNQLSFRQFVKDAEKLKYDWRPKAKQTSITRYLWTGDDGAIRAQALLRFPLDPQSEVDGGNLVVSVPPSLRGRGFGSYALALLLFEAVRSGLRRALATCPADDGAARRMIEKNRGALQDEVPSNHPDREGHLTARYWISFS